MDNNYESQVFLSGLLAKPDYLSSRVWTEHQQMQVRFLLARGFSADSNVLDLVADGFGHPTQTMACFRPLQTL